MENSAGKPLFSILTDG